MDYIDFVLKVGPRVGENSYQVSARSDAMGEVSGTFTPPLSDIELENLVLKLRLKRGVRQMRSPEWRSAQEFGLKLFRALMSEDVRAGFSTTHNAALNQGKGLRVKLALDATVPELGKYPWEFLYDPVNAQFLTLFEDTPIVRYVELQRPLVPLNITPPLRIVGMVSSPSDYDLLDVTREQSNLKNALKELIETDLVELDWLASATLDELREQMLKKTYHIFHFVGHGGFSEAAEDGLLVFEDAQKHSKPISGERLAYILGNNNSLRLAFLNACEGARTSKQDPFSGVATTLVRTGNLPAVVAMQFEISDDAAINFARGFYSAVAAGRPLDAAVSQGRQAIFAQDNDIEWCTPVLYLRAPDGKIFNIDLEAQARIKEQLERAKKEQAEQLEQERLKNEQEQQANRAREEAERERLKKEQAERERETKEGEARKQLASERSKQKRLAKKKADEEKAAREQAELERLARKKVKPIETIKGEPTPVRQPLRDLSVANLVAQFDQVYAKADWDRGIQIGESILNLDANHPIRSKLGAAYDQRSLLFYQRSDYGRAISDSTRAIELDSNKAEYYFARGRIYNNQKFYTAQGNYNLALADYTRAIELNPQKADYFLERGKSYTNVDDYAHAIADYDHAIQLDSRKAEYYYWRAVSYHNQKYYFGKGDYEHALADYGRAIELDAKKADYYWDRGKSFNAKGDYDRAIADYTHALELNSKNPEYYLSRGVSYYNKRNDYVRAIADFTRAIELNPKNANYYYWRGQSYHNQKFYTGQGDYERAIADYTHALELNPKNPEYYLSRGQSYHNKRNDYVRAIADFTKAIELDPKNADYYYWRGVSYHNQKFYTGAGDYDRAIADLNRALELAPNNAQYLYTRGLSYQLKGDKASAKSNFQKAADLGHKEAQQQIKK